VNARISRPVALSYVKQPMLVTFQVAGLLAISEVGNFIARWLNVPIPGNVIGMLLLLGLLSSKALRPEWIESGGGLLLKHLAFFFIPITVGLMELTDVLRSSWPGLLMVLMISTAVGIVASGFSAQALTFLHKNGASDRRDPATH
jgi:holin-like protein